MPDSAGAEEGAARRLRAAFVRGIDRITGVFNALGSAAIFAMMLLICADISGRYFFNAPIAGVTEIVEIAIVAIVFAQLADTTARDRLTRADTILIALRQNRPGLARLVDGLAAMTGIVLMAILAYGVIPAMIRDYERGFYVGNVGIFTFPTWPVKMVIAIGVILTAFQLLFLVARAAFGGNEQYRDGSAP